MGIIDNTEVMLLWLTAFSRFLCAKSDGFPWAALIIPLIRPVLIICWTRMVSTVKSMCEIKYVATHPTGYITERAPRSDPPIQLPPVALLLGHTVQEELFEVKSSVSYMPGYHTPMEIYEYLGLSTYSDILGI